MSHGILVLPHRFAFVWTALAARSSGRRRVAANIRRECRRSGTPWNRSTWYSASWRTDTTFCDSLASIHTWDTERQKLRHGW